MTICFSFLVAEAQELFFFLCYCGRLKAQKNRTASQVNETEYTWERERNDYEAQRRQRKKEKRYFFAARTGGCVSYDAKNKNNNNNNNNKKKNVRIEEKFQMKSFRLLLE